MVEGVVRTIPAQTVRLANMSFGPVSRDNLDVPILPRSLLNADGYLGLDAIDGYRVTLDFKNRALEVSQPRHARFIGWTRRAKRWFRHWPVRTFTLRQLQGRRHSCDRLHRHRRRSLGRQRKIVRSLDGNQPNLPQARDRATDRRHRRRRPRPYHDGQQGPLDSLTFEGCNIVIADLQIFDLWGLSETPALLIGMNFLRQFSRVSIDYGRKELDFELAKLVVARQI